MDESIISKLSYSEEEPPLVPDNIDDDYFKELIDKIPEITIFLKQQKDYRQHYLDNIQRLILCANRFKTQFNAEFRKSQELKDEIDHLKIMLNDMEESERVNVATITELRNVIEKSWRQADAAHIREQTTKGELVQTKELMEQLQETVKKLSDARSPYRQKDDHSKDRERMQNELNDLKKRLQIQRNYTGDLEEKNQILETKMKNFIKTLDETSMEAYHNKRRVDELTKQVDEYEMDNKKLSDDIIELKEELEKLTKLKVRHNLQILSLKTNMEHLNEQHNNVCNKLAKMTVDLEYSTQERDKYKRDLAQKVALLKMKEDEMIKYRRENTKLSKLQDTISRKFTNIEEAKKCAEQEVLRLRIQLSNQEKMYDALRRVVQQIENKNNQLTLERDHLKKNLLLERKNREQMEVNLQESNHQISSLKDTIQLQERKSKKLLDEIMQLNGDKCKKLEEIQMLLDKIDSLQDKIRLKESYEIELKRTVSDVEGELAKIQSKYNNLMNDHNTVQRNFNSLKEELNKFQINFDEQKEIIENLKKKMNVQDDEISKLQLQSEKLEKEKRLIKHELRYQLLQHQQMMSELIEKRKDHDEYKKRFREDQKKMKRLQRDLENLISEKKSLSSLLNKRDEELQHARRELDNLQNSYNQLQSEMLENQDNLNLLRSEIRNISTERDVLRRDRESAVDLRHELLQMHRKLNQERIKARALQDEMLTPMNIHRWRTLKGKDPEKMDLIQKLQTLRKQLLHYNVVKLEKDRALKQSQYVCEALKEFMKKLPSIKIKDELNHLKAALKQKEKKLKSLMAEINMKCMDEGKLRLELDNLKIKLSRTKEQLLEERKMRERLLAERDLFMETHMPAECLSAPPQLEERTKTVDD